MADETVDSTSETQESVSAPAAEPAKAEGDDLHYYDQHGDIIPEEAEPTESSGPAEPELTETSDPPPASSEEPAESPTTEAGPAPAQPKHFGLDEDAIDTQLGYIADLQQRAKGGDAQALTALQVLYRQTVTGQPTQPQVNGQDPTAQTVAPADGAPVRPKIEQFMPQGAAYDPKDASFPGTSSYEARMKLDEAMIEYHQQYADHMAAKSATDLHDRMRREQMERDAQHQFEQDVNAVITEFKLEAEEAKTFRDDLNSIMNGQGLRQFNQQDVLRVFFRGLNYDSLVQKDVENRLVAELAEFGISHKPGAKSVTRTPTSRPEPARERDGLDEVIDS